MNLKLIAAGFLALAVVATGAAAALPGNAPVDAPADDKTDVEIADGAGEQHAAQDRERHAVQSQEQRAEGTAAGQQGPPMDLPGQVPDFVGEVHDLIRQHVDGTLEGILGHQVSDVTPDDETTPDRSNDAPASAA